MRYFFGVFEPFLYQINCFTSKNICFRYQKGTDYVTPIVTPLVTPMLKLPFFTILQKGTKKALTNRA